MTDLQGFTSEELTALARIDIEQGRLDHALARLKRVLAGHEPPADAIGMAARLYARLGLVDQAQPLYRQYLSMRPGSLEEEFQLGMLQFNRGEADAAMALWEGTLRRDAVFPPSLYYCAVVLKEKGRLAEARRNLDVLLRTAPVDNLYFERSKDLLHAIDRLAIPAAPAVDKVHAA